MSRLVELAVGHGLLHLQMLLVQQVELLIEIVSQGRNALVIAMVEELGAGHLGMAVRADHRELVAVGLMPVVLLQGKHLGAA